MTVPQSLALEKSDGLDPTAKNIDRVAAETSGEDARWAFEQWALRTRARSKFARSAQMLFDRDGLEMASHEDVARYHASLFPRGELVVDLTCGIGSDLIALAGRGPAIGFEIDPRRAEFAKHNLEVHNVRAEVICADALAQVLGDGSPQGAHPESPIQSCRFAFCDPSRRANGRRLAKMEDFAPDPFQIADFFRTLDLGVMKLSPMLPDSDLARLGGGIRFVSYGGECREALVHIPGPQDVSAVHIASGEVLRPSEPMPATDAPSAFLFEADPAAIRAHCLSELCRRYELLPLGDSNGYLTGPRNRPSPWLKGYEVLACHGADVKRTARELARLGGGTPIVKSRAPGIDVQGLGKALSGEGKELVLVVFLVGRRLKHAICRPVGANLPQR